jgi:hypothetical protein
MFPTKCPNKIKWLLLFITATAFSLSASAQVRKNDSIRVVYPDGGDQVVLSPSNRRNRPAPVDTTEAIDSLDTPLQSIDKYPLSADGSSKDDQPLSLKKNQEKPSKRNWLTWRPNPKRALWMALVIPGGGQIYNRKYWKLPIFYGGFVGCIYAITWNNQMYHDYAQAYMDIMDDNPDTKSYEQFLHFNTQITESNRSRYQELFRKRKNRYRRWRDLASFVTMAVYALSVIDAYVDASLSDFDITPDLSLHVAPRVLNDGSSINPLQSPAIGLGVGLKF